MISSPPSAKRRDVITDERPGHAHEYAGDDAAARSGELAGEPGRARQPVEENAGDDTDRENQKKEHDRVTCTHGSDPPHRLRQRPRSPKRSCDLGPERSGGAAAIP